MTNQILVVGSVAFDSITTPFGKADNTLGGSATYFSLASSLFAPTSIVGVVGNDFRDFDIYRKHRIDISGMEKQKGETFYWAGKYHYDLNIRDTLKLKLGVFENFQPKLSERHKQAEMVFLANIQPHLQLQVLKQIKRPKLVGLDTATEWINRSKPALLRVLKLVDIFVINDSEARQLSKEHNLLKAAKKILFLMNQPDTFTRPRKSVRNKHQIVIIKQGEHGLLLFHQSSIFNLPGYPLEDVIDPTGAGDSFAGALMGYLAKTGDLSPANLKKACAVASTVASFCVENFGTKRLQSIRLSDVNQRLAEYKKLINF